MSQAQSPPPGSGDQRQPTELNRDVVLDVLNNKRRRYVVHLLKRAGDTAVSTTELAEQIAAWELEKSRSGLTYKERKRVKNALRQFHLPKMDEIGFVEFDARAGTVTLSQAADEQNFYVDVLSGRQIPWGMYYLGLSTISILCLAGLIVEIPLFASISPLSVFAGLTVTLAISSLGHFYDNYYRMQLGAQETPPEVDAS